MRTKLLSYLHSVFDKDPYRVLVLRISHFSIAQWSISDRTLHLGTLANPGQHTFDLRQYTLGGLAEQVRYAGFGVPYLHPSYSSRPADILLDGEGVETSHNGDHLYTFSSTLWAILNTVGLTLVQTRENAVLKGIKMAYFHSATKFWLDQWTSWFGSARKDGESDADCLARTVAETARIRNTPNALKNAVKALTGINVFIHELWRDYYDADNPSRAEGTWCRFEAIIYHDITEEEWAKVIEVIERNRPVGVLFEGIVRALQYLYRQDIDYEVFLEQHQELVDWNINHDWTKDSDGGFYQWDDVTTVGLNISMAMS